MQEQLSWLQRSQRGELSASSKKQPLRNFVVHKTQQKKVRRPY